MWGSERGFQTWNKDITMTLEMDVRRKFLLLRAGGVLDANATCSVCARPVEI